MNKLIAISLLLASTACAQAALPDLRRAVLAGQGDEAQALLHEAQIGMNQARAALLEVSLHEPWERALRCLALCRFETDPAAIDRALLAGAGALLAARGRGELARGLETDVDDCFATQREAAGEVLAGLREVLRARTALGGDAGLLREARWMLATAAIVGVENEPLFVASAGSTPMPAPLAEPLDARFLPWPLDRDPWLVDREPSAAFGGPVRLRPGSERQVVPLPPPGSYLLELESARGWRRLRRVVVSDLSLHALVVHDSLCVLAELGGKPAAGVTVTARGSGRGREGTVTGTTRADGLVSLRLPEATHGRSRWEMETNVVSGTLGSHLARVTAATWAREGYGLDARQRAHLMIDRPMYRPGETVRGRLVVRTFGVEPGAGGVSPVSAMPAAGIPVELRFWPGEPQQKMLSGAADPDGVFTFTLPLPAATELGEARVEITAGAHKSSERPFRVAEFRRPVLLAELACPETWNPRDGTLMAVLSARYASGAPAAGVEVSLDADGGGHAASRRTVLDAAGRAEIAVASGDLAFYRRGSISLEAQFFCPDGQVLKERRAIRIETQATAEVPRTDNGLVLAVEPAEPRAGQPLSVALSGPAHATVLFVAFRDAPLELRRVVLDARGRATLRVETQASHWPQVELGACLAAGTNERAGRGPYDHLAATSVRLLRPEGRLELALAPHEERVAPGAPARFALQTRDADGRGVRATVAVAIVDERVFRSTPDRTRHPEGALSPGYGEPALGVGSCRVPSSPLHLLGELLADGTVSPPFTRRGRPTPGPSGPTTGGPGGPGGSDVLLRARFEPTALFVGALATDADGKADFTCVFPHDLTRWRITLVAVDDSARACRTVSHIETALQLSVTPITPRVLRTGDRIDVPLSVAGIEAARGRTDVHGEIAGDSVTCLSGADATVELASAVPVTTTLALRAATTGTAALRVSARNASAADRIELPLRVQADEAVRTSAARFATIDALQQLEVPAVDGRPAQRVALTLLGGRDALLADAASYLDDYPHGCVEQICSKLVPLVVARRAARLAGGNPELLATAQALRIDAGMLALRAHLLGRGEGFRWYHGSQADLGMTALALGVLAQAKEAGIDAGAYGIDIGPGSRRLGELAKQLVLRQGMATQEEWQAADCVAACLSYEPALPEALAAVRALVTAEQTLPVGLLARAGVALAHAGDLERARATLDRVLSGTRVDTARWQFPGESTAARAAHLLELVLRAAPERRELRGRLVAELMAFAAGRGEGTTYAAAQALQALAREAEASGRHAAARPFAARVACGTLEQRVTFDQENGFRVRLELASAEPVRIEPDAGHTLYAVIGGQRRETGSTSSTWSSPLKVSRDLTPVGPRQRPGAGGALERGRAHLLTLVVSAPERVSHVLVQCPLPAGFEVLGDPAADVHDDRIVTSLDEVAPGHAAVLKFFVIPSLVGDVAWPPATAESMYLPGTTGASTGSRLEVVASKAAEAAKTAEPLLLGSKPPELAGAELVGALRHADSWRLRAELRSLGTHGRAAALRALRHVADELIARWEDGDPSLLLELGGTLLELPQTQGPEPVGPLHQASRLATVMCFATGMRREGNAAFPAEVQRLVEEPRASALPDSTLLKLAHLALTTGLSRDLALACQRDGIRDEPGDSVDPAVAAWGSLHGVLGRLYLEDLALHQDELAGLARITAERDHWDDSRGGLPFAPGGASGPSLALIEGLERALRSEIRAAFAARAADPAPLGTRDPLVPLDFLDANDPERSDRIAGKVLADLLARDTEEAAGWFESALGRLDARQTAAQAGLLARAREHPREDVRRAALAAVPAKQWIGLPLPLLWRILPALPDSEWADLLAAAGTEGRRLLCAWVAKAGAGDDPEDIAVALGPELASAPLEVLRALAEAEPARAVLVRRRFPEQQLAAELAGQRDPVWRAAVVRALGELPPVEVPFAADDAAGALFGTALRAFHGDAAAGARVRALLAADDVAIVAGDGDGVVRDLLLASIGRQTTPKDLLAWGSDVAPDDRARAISGFDREQINELLASARDDAWFDPALVPEPRVDEVRAELFRVAEVSEQHREAVLARLLERPERASFVSTSVAGVRDNEVRRQLIDTLRRLAERGSSAPAGGTELVWIWRRRGLE